MCRGWGRVCIGLAAWAAVCWAIACSAAAPLGTANPGGDAHITTCITAHLSAHIFSVESKSHVLHCDSQVLPDCVAIKQSMDRHQNHGAPAVADMACQAEGVGLALCWRSPSCMQHMTQHSASEIQLAVACTGCIPLQLWPSW